MTLSEPRQEQDWRDYFDLRWRVLRAPWQQARGTERDELDSLSSTVLVKHILARNTAGDIIGVGRIHQCNDDDAQIRYMAVKESCRRQGVAGLMLLRLELHAVQWHSKRIILNARQDIQLFYAHYDYKVAAKGELLFNKVPHTQMVKSL